MFIAEQQMVSAAVGLAVLGKVAFASTFAAFFTRAYDQIRMAAVSNASIRLSGSHAGVSIGQDGPSQMGLEDIAIFRAVNGSVVLYPSDAVSAERLTEYMARTDGIIYLRTSRPKTPLRWAQACARCTKMRSDCSQPSTSSRTRTPGKSISCDCRPR